MSAERSERSCVAGPGRSRYEVVGAEVVVTGVAGREMACPTPGEGAEPESAREVAGAFGAHPPTRCYRVFTTAARRPEMIIIDRLMIMSTNPTVPIMVFPSLVDLRVPWAVFPAPARRVTRSFGRGMYLFGGSPYLAPPARTLRVASVPVPMTTVGVGEPPIGPTRVG